MCRNSGVLTPPRGLTEAGVLGSAPRLWCSGSGRGTSICVSNETRGLRLVQARSVRARFVGNFHTLWMNGLSHMISEVPKTHDPQIHLRSALSLESHLASKRSARRPRWATDHVRSQGHRVPTPSLCPPVPTFPPISQAWCLESSPEVSLRSHRPTS